MRVGGQRHAPTSFSPEKRLGERKSVTFGESKLDSPAFQSRGLCHYSDWTIIWMYKIPAELHIFYLCIWPPPPGEGKRVGGEA